jgi:ParB family chromosome partitioning protein
MISTVSASGTESLDSNGVPPIGRARKKELPAPRQQSPPATLAILEVARIRRYPNQPRKNFNQAELEALGKSLLKGQIIPIKVRRVSDDPRYDYELIDGERRWRASKLVGLTTIIALIEEITDEREQYLQSFVSNLRVENDPLERARAFNRMRREFGMSLTEIAEITGCSAGSVSQYIRVFEMPSEIQDMMSASVPEDERLPFASALRLSKFPRKTQIRYAKQLIEKGITSGNVRLFLREQVHRDGLADHQPRPYRDYQAINGVVARLITELDSYNRTPADAVKKMLLHRSAEDIDGLIDRIEQAKFHLSELHRRVQENRPKLVTTAKKK